jgi:signal transduction histidine kinase
MKKIGSKLFISFLLMAALTIGLLWLVQGGFMKDSYLNGRVASVESAVKKIALSDAPVFDNLKDELNINLVLINQDGSVKSITQGIPMMGMVVKTCQSMIPGQIDGTVRLIDSMSGSSRYALLGNAIKGGGYVFAMFSLADVDAASQILREQLWLITLLLILSSIIIAVVLSRMFARPIRAVTGAARELAAGHLDVSLPVRSKDEIGDLTVALNELSVQLQHTDMLRKELIANVSHELRAPLTIIQGYAETVRDVTWPIEEKRTQQLDMISQEATRLSRVVTDILDYSKLQAGVEKLAITPFEVCPVLDQIFKRYELAASRKNIVIVFQCPPALIRFDRDKFDQVLNNLLSNAISHADQNSEIRVSVTPQDGVSRTAITNYGAVIPFDEIPHIWDRYYRAQNIGENSRIGTGLGLSIVKSILLKHEVAFGVDSADGKTTFWFDSCPISE